MDDAAKAFVPLLLMAQIVENSLASENIVYIFYKILLHIRFVST